MILQDLLAIIGTIAGFALAIALGMFGAWGLAMMTLMIAEWMPA